MNLNEFMHNYEAKIAQNKNNSFTRHILIYLDDVLHKISVVDLNIIYLIIKIYIRQN
jgi:hypothetical protein